MVSQMCRAVRDLAANSGSLVVLFAVWFAFLVFAGVVLAVLSAVTAVVQFSVEGFGYNAPPFWPTLGIAFLVVLVVNLLRGSAK
jgi:hypothetical protein